MSDMGKRIRRAREARNMTQDELAERLFVTRQTVSNYETGRSRPDVDTLVQLGEALGLDAEELLGAAPAEHTRGKAAAWLAVSAAALLVERLWLLPWLDRLMRDIYVTGPSFWAGFFLDPALWLWLGWQLGAAIRAFGRYRQPREPWVRWLHRALWVPVAVYLLLMVPKQNMSAAALLAVGTLLQLRPAFTLVGLGLQLL